jgi:hypothetical protein
MGPRRDRVVSQYEMRQKEKEKDYRGETIECVDMLTFESRVPGTRRWRTVGVQVGPWSRCDGVGAGGI